MQGKLGRGALESLATEQMLNNYMMSHRTEIERDQKGVAAMQAVFTDQNLIVTEEEITAEVTKAEREFQVWYDVGMATLKECVDSAGYGRVVRCRSIEGNGTGSSAEHKSGAVVHQEWQHQDPAV